MSILTEENDIRIEIRRFIDKFKFVNNRYEFKPVGKERIESASLRNFLIDFGIIDLHRDQIKYFIPEHITFYLQSETRNPRLSEYQFKALLLFRGKLGRKAEIEVLTYEKNRLKEWKKFHNEIKHIALQDVGAGYDIKSFDMVGSELFPRYIEVKATSMLGKRFFWSNNEIECAQLNGNKYYLYLIPIGENSKVLIDKLEIIQDPYKHVFNNKKAWVGDIELMSFRKGLINGN